MSRRSTIFIEVYIFQGVFTYLQTDRDNQANETTLVVDYMEMEKIKALKIVLDPPFGIGRFFQKNRENLINLKILHRY